MSFELRNSGCGPRIDSCGEALRRLRRYGHLWERFAGDNLTGLDITPRVADWLVEQGYVFVRPLPLEPGDNRHLWRRIHDDDE